MSYKTRNDLICREYEEGKTTKEISADDLIDRG